MIEFNYSIDKQINMLYQDGLFEDKCIILFGANTFSMAMIDCLSSKNISVKAVLDNNNYKQNTMFYKDIYIFNPEEYLKNTGQNIVILCASKYYRHILKQLENLGYKENIHIFKILDFDVVISEFEALCKNKNIELVELNLSDIQSTTFNILKYIRDICEENELRYFLDAGTLLGAVRHKGFIPWDDDVDISMPFSDYNKLIDIVINDNKFEVYNYNNSRVPRIFTRVADPKTISIIFEYPVSTHNPTMGIDIFPIFGLPDDHQDKYEQMTTDLRQKINYAFYEDSIKNSEISRNNLISYQNQLMDLYSSYEFGKFAKCNKFSPLSKVFVSYDAYSSAIKTEFQNELFSIPKGYEEVLTYLYGDYMKVPPIGERGSDHQYKAYALR